MKFTKYLFAIFLLLIWILVFLRGILFLDPDFGWHFQAGHVILTSGIPKTDPFSYTMPSYRFIDHEWGINIVINILYRAWGIYGLSLTFSTLFVLSLVVSAPKKFKKYSIIPIILSGCLMLAFTGVRTQVITWVFLTVLFRIILDDRLWRKWKFIIPLMFIFWVNLHGGFAAGIAVLFIVFLTKSINKREINKDSLAVFLLSLAATFLNPYGPYIWHEIWMQASDFSLHSRIAEWSPGIYYFNFAALAFVALSISFVVKYRKKIGITALSIYLFLLLMAASSLRNIPLWALFAIPVTSNAFFLFSEEVGQNKENLARFNKTKRILAAAIFFIVLYEVGQEFINLPSLNQNKSYPVGAVSYLNKQKIDGQVFSIYDWGGYLIWKMPQKKVFIDGRMPSWRREGNYPGESNYAFDDYLKAFSSASFFKQTMTNYHVEYVLIPNDSGLKKPKSALSLEIEKLEKLFSSNQNRSVISSQYLNKIGMQKVYQDQTSVVLYKWKLK